MSGTVVVLAILVFAVLVTLARGVCIVPQGHEYVVERLGKYHATLKPGLSILVPYIDAVAYRVPTKDMPVEIADLEAITKDNAVIIVNAISFIKVLDPVKSVYGVQNYHYAIQNLIMTTLRAIVGHMEIDEALTRREEIKARLKEGIATDASDWGIVVKSAEVRDIRPSDSMQVAMEKQATAERTKRATITTAEGDKQAQILKAEGTLEAARREAEAQIVLADASARAIQDIAVAIGDKELPAVFLLGDRYVKMLQQVAASPNSKIVILPPDIKGAVRGLLGKE
jgi:regulator of protease activity HflC (stomatin/prohibitin superfamily)